MPIALLRHFNFGQKRAGSETENVARLARLLFFGAAIVAIAYFGFLYLLAGRD